MDPQHARRSRPARSDGGGVPASRRSAAERVVRWTGSALGIVEALTRLWPRRSSVGGSSPGLLIVQIDGLAAPILRDMVQSGQAPVIARLLSSGAAVLREWSTLGPSSTPASQAGILHGRNDDIPGFRWYEKRARRLLVGDHPTDAAEIVRRVSDGRGLLADDGVSIGNLVTGDAVRSYLTMATVANRSRRTGALERSRRYFLRPSTYVRLVAVILREVFSEAGDAIAQRKARRRPRMHRGFVTAVERGLAAGALRLVSSELVAEEMADGAATIYVDFTGYDEVAHHSGPTRPEALAAASAIDATIGRLLRLSRRAARGYQLVVLSDHGQSHGAPFEQRFGERLEDVFVRLTGGNAAIRSATLPVEHRRAGVRLGAEAAEAVGVAMPRRLLHASAKRQGVVDRGAPASGGEPEIVLCASGNLAHVYFTFAREPVTESEIEAVWPGLIDGLVGHPGVGLVVVRRPAGSLVLGSGGTRDVGTGAIVGHDPLTPYGERAAESLARLASFGNSGDLIILTTMLPDDAVVSIEDLVGSHGGLGGAQTRPFVLHPAEWPIQGDLVGAPSLYQQLRSWQRLRLVPPVPTAPVPTGSLRSRGRSRNRPQRNRGSRLFPGSE